MRAKPHFYGVGDAQATIGFLEKTVSYYGTSEFLVLGAARTAPTHDLVGVVASALEPTVYAYSAATTRIQFRTRRQYEITAQDCSAAIEYASPIRLSQILQAAAEKLVKRREPPKGLSMEQHRAEVRQALYQEESARQRLPRHTTEIAVMRIRELHNVQSMHGIQGKDIALNIGIYQGIVASRFTSLWEIALVKAEQDAHKAKGKQKKTESTGKNGGPSTSKKVDGAEDGGPSTSTMVDGAEDGENTDEEDDNELEKEKERIRTCTISFKNILREDLAHLQQDILEAFQAAQCEVTDDMSELSVLVQKAVVSVAGGAAYDGRWQADPKDPKILDVRDLLPDKFPSRAEHVDPVLHVARIPDGLQEAIERALDGKECTPEDSDLATIQSQGFLQHLHASFLGNRGTNSATKLRHPIWECLVQEIAT
ncbi:hypothetical protein BGZ75_001264, partial [Mortierella antarctica]